MYTYSVVGVSLQAFYGRKPQGLNGALQEVGITFEGREHSGNVCNVNRALLRTFVPQPLLFVYFDRENICNVQS